jgi:hypothetical protein
MKLLSEYLSLNFIYMVIIRYHYPTKSITSTIKKEHLYSVSYKFKLLND